ncbi:MAG: VOC family protein [Acidimicrobiia bacterium]
MEVNGIAYTVVFAKDYQQMKSFYEELFGRKAEEAHPPEEWATWNFEGSNTGFAIHGGAGGEHPAVLPVLTAEDLRQTVKQMKARGVEVTKDVYEEQPGLLAVDIRDPEGNPINLVEVRS